MAEYSLISTRLIQPNKLGEGIRVQSTVNLLDRSLVLSFLKDLFHFARVEKGSKEKYEVFKSRFIRLRDCLSLKTLFDIGF
jgi:hypothetical protein